MSGLERVHLPSQSVIEKDTERRHLQAQFERSMTWRLPDGSHGGGDGAGSDDDAEQGGPGGRRGNPEGMPREALSWLQRSLGSPSQEGNSAQAVSTLLLEISQAIRAGRRYPGDKWRLLVRVREELLERTEIEIAANAGRMSVSMRTSSDESFRTIGAALGRLNSQLASMNLVDEGVKVFLVSLKDLS